MIPPVVDAILLGTELTLFTTMASAIIAETLLSREAKAAIGAWILRKVYENYFA